MRIWQVMTPALLGCAMGLSAAAQAQTQTPPPAAMATVEREWVPEGIVALGRSATSRTEFTLDHSMLVLAAKLDPDNENLRRVIAGVNGVSVHSFRFADEVFIDPAAMEAVMQQYREAGWQHLVSKQKSDGGGHTELWLKMDGGAVRNIAVLFAGRRQLNFVSVSGSITPLDLLHLSGHFGIPKMDSGVTVPVKP